MPKKRSKVWTVLFSLLPGAGHMFMGFMKRGLSLMSLFFFIIFLSSWLGIGPLLYIIPVLWFYSFFECINLTCADDQEFARMEDRYLFHLDSLTGLSEHFSTRTGFYAGILLLFFGLYLIAAKLLSQFRFGLLPQAVRYFEGILSVFPQVLVGVVIILIGIRLIKGKREELERHD
ncbi:hypothetical protein EQM14_12475 [Caproiciproducens sp. NJN-50]|uniref:hypothetical protein n=1 Tax=Acutalibacteraceae TaxID=3082771 RepID=UPI000FFE29E1|nr:MULTISPECIES: hypothetical protein [Acutalibacteraceae]QAT50512.1 hypothetical protein EQM14_12475 [Caproiciproducens sp. NJN-50]